MHTQVYEEVRSFMYRNARHLELCLWQYYFENGSKEAVVDALMFYQNEDGGFGHALEADNWNPNSTPIATEHALKILRKIDFVDMKHPVYQGIFRYLYSEKDLLSYGWRFTIPSNDANPCAPWWNYNEEENKKEYFGVTASLAAFILQYGEPQTALWQKAKGLADELLRMLLADGSYGDMGLESYIILVETVRELQFPEYDYGLLFRILSKKIQNRIEHDTTKWKFYTPRPSIFIHSPDSPFYEENAEIVEKELEYLLANKPENDVWGITWTWFGNMEKYEQYFRISENWWKGLRAVEAMHFLRSFGKI